MHYGNGDCGCQGLSGIDTQDLSGLGIVSATPTGVTDCSGLPILERLACEAQKLLSRTSEISRPVPVYNPPGYPSNGSYGYPEEYAPQETNVFPWLIVGLVGLALISRK